MKKGLFVKKSIGSLLKSTAGHKNGLKRTLGPLNLIAMGIGAIIGAGLFVLTGEVAANFAGPGILISFVIAAVIATLAALCYAEFASLIPVAGSVYTYAFVAVGEFFAWIMGVAITIQYLFSFCAVAVAWSGYLGSFIHDLGLPWSTALSQAPLMYTDGGWEATGAIVNLPAMIIIALLALLVARGIQTAALLNDLLVVVKLGVLILFIGFGLFFIQGANLTPFIPENTGVFGEFGWSGIFRGAGVLFFAFLGFDAIATLAQEAKNPQRDMPVGMMGSLVICTLLYMIFGLVMTGSTSYTLLGVADPVSVAVNSFGPHFIWLRYIIKLAILAGLSSVILVMITAQSRILYTMAQDGLLPSIFAKTHPTHRTPFYTTLIVAAVAMGIAGFFPVGILGQITSMGALFVFGMVCLGVLVLRFTQPTLHRPFKTPFTPWIPLLGTVACLLQMFMMPLVTWIQFIVTLAIGCSIYFLYGQKHSKMRNG
ncbi:MAG: amino acid permease [Candidatus Rhabdochlamydia sp.]